MSIPPANVVSNEVRERPLVLVMDDDPVFRKLLTHLLKQKYQVAEATDGLLGLKAAKELRPDVAVVDVEMPGLDGLQVLAAMRQEPSLSGMWTMMLTGDSSRETVVAAIKAGAHDYIIKKAFSREEFLSRVERLLLRSVTSATTPATQGGSPNEKTPDPGHSVPEPHHTTAGTAMAAVATVPLEGPVSRGGDTAQLQEILDSWD